MIKTSNLKFSYNNSSDLVLKGINLEIKDGEFLCIIGHSGCGKSTLIRLLAGLEKPAEGSIKVNETELKGPGTDRAVVFQQYSLFPWQSVYKNVYFATMERGRYTKTQARSRTEYFLKKTGMSEHHRKLPCQLSGGMKQRTAIARALSMGSEILLLDEPFGALDVQNRTSLQVLLRRLWKEEKKTIVFVTHDLEEALNLGSRIVFMKDGIIEKEMDISEKIHCCCVNGEGLEDCKNLRQSLEEWYRK